MIHPDTELRFIDTHIGYGIFATRRIPKGTITWVRDDLDQIFSPERASHFAPFLRERLERYSFIDNRGDYVLCWDHARFMNHSCEPTCLSPGYGFEIALRDIEAGQEMTDDYGSLNIDVGFSCLCGSPRCRREIMPDDLLVYGDQWDALLEASMSRLFLVEQPLWSLVQEKDELSRLAKGMVKMPSCRENYHRHPSRPAPARYATSRGA